MCVVDHAVSLPRVLLTPTLPTAQGDADARVKKIDAEHEVAYHHQRMLMSKEVASDLPDPESPSFFAPSQRPRLREISNVNVPNFRPLNYLAAAMGTGGNTLDKDAKAADDAKVPAADDAEAAANAANAEAVNAAKVVDDAEAAVKAADDANAAAVTAAEDAKAAAAKAAEDAKAAAKAVDDAKAAAAKAGADAKAKGKAADDAKAKGKAKAKAADDAKAKAKAKAADDAKAKAADDAKAKSIYIQEANAKAIRQRVNTPKAKHWKKQHLVAHELSKQADEEALEEAYQKQEAKRKQEDEERQVQKAQRKAVRDAEDLDWEAEEEARQQQAKLRMEKHARLKFFENKALEKKSSSSSPKWLSPKKLRTACDVEIDTSLRVHNRDDFNHGPRRGQRLSNESQNESHRSMYGVLRHFRDRFAECNQRSHRRKAMTALEGNEDLMIAILTHVADSSKSFASSGNPYRNLQGPKDKSMCALVNKGFSRAIRTSQSLLLQQWQKAPEMPLLQRMTVSAAKRFEDFNYLMTCCRSAPMSPFLMQEMKSFLGSTSYMMSDDVFDVSLGLMCTELGQISGKKVLCVPSCVWNYGCPGSIALGSAKYTAENFSYENLMQKKLPGCDYMKTGEHISDFDMIVSGVCIRNHFVALCVDVQKGEIHIADPLKTYTTDTENGHMMQMMHKLIQKEWEKLVNIPLDASFVEPTTMPNFMFKDFDTKFQMSRHLACGPLSLMFCHCFVMGPLDPNSFAVLDVDASQTKDCVVLTEWPMQFARGHLFNMVFHDGDATCLSHGLQSLVTSWRKGYQHFMRSNPNRSPVLFDTLGGESVRSQSMQADVVKQTKLHNLSRVDIRYHTRDTRVHVWNSEGPEPEKCEVLIISTGSPREHCIPIIVAGHVPGADPRDDQSLFVALAALARRRTRIDYTPEAIKAILIGQQRLVDTCSRTFPTLSGGGRVESVMEHVLLFSMAFHVSVTVRTSDTVSVRIFATTNAPSSTLWLREKLTCALKKKDVFMCESLKDLSRGLGLAILLPLVEGAFSCPEDDFTPFVLRSKRLLRNWFLKAMSFVPLEIAEVDGGRIFVVAFRNLEGVAVD